MGGQLPVDDHGMAAQSLAVVAHEEQVAEVEVGVRQGARPR